MRAFWELHDWLWGRSCSDTFMPCDGTDTIDAGRRSCWQVMRMQKNDFMYASTMDVAKIWAGRQRLASSSGRTAFSGRYERPHWHLSVHVTT